MSKKSRLDLRKIIREFGFIVDVHDLEDTLKIDCFNEKSDLYGKTKKFFDSYGLAENEELTKEKIFEDFLNNFTKNEELFDVEVYMLKIALIIDKYVTEKKVINEILKKYDLNDLQKDNDDNIMALIYKQSNVIDSLKAKMFNKGLSQNTINSVEKIILNLPYINIWLPPKFNIKNIEHLLDSIKKNLSNVDVILIDKVTGNNISTINSQIFIGNTNFLEKKERENIKRFNNISKEIDLESKIKKLTPSMYKYVFRYDNLGLELSKRMYYTDKEIAESDDKNFEKDPEMNDAVYLQTDILETTKDSLKYIDMDKLLLAILQMEFNKYDENINKFTYEEIIALKDLSKKIQNFLTNKNTEIYSEHLNKRISFNDLNNKLEILNNSYISGIYYDENELDILSKEYIQGEKDIKILTPHEFKSVLKFTDNEIIEILKNNSSSLEYIIENNILDYSDKKQENNTTENKKLFDLIEKQDKITGKQLEILYNHNLLTSNYLYEQYMNTNKIEIESIQYLKEKIDKDFFEDLVNSKTLTDLYLSGENEKENFYKYSKLFNELEIRGKNSNEKNDISNDILNQSIELLEEEKIMELYTLGLLTIDTVIDYTGSFSLKQLYLSNELKPIDARRLYYEGVINEDMLKSIMQDTTIDIGKRITLLFSTFPNEEDTKIRKMLEFYLNEVNENSLTNSNKIKRVKPGNIRTSLIDDLIVKSRKKRAYEPCAKYRLIETIDKDYKFKYNEKDGTAIFYFPNREEYLIEKLYDRDRKPATDVATYILSKNLYEKNEHKVVQDGKINISELYVLKKENSSEVKRLIHTGWANGLLKYYDLDNEKEQVVEIKKLAKQVEDSKKEIER